jgi:hypothetical protein
MKSFQDYKTTAEYQIKRTAWIRRTQKPHNMHYIGTLGENQRLAYKALLEHGSWYPGCDWILSNRSATIRLLDSLVRRGYASKETRTVVSQLSGLPIQVTIYKATNPI